MSKGTLRTTDEQDELLKKIKLNLNVSSNNKAIGHLIEDYDISQRKIRALEIKIAKVERELSNKNEITNTFSSALNDFLKMHDNEYCGIKLPRKN